jgi:SAM-dependent methyltransferase
MREELALNRDHWDESTTIHTAGNVYGIDDFKAGRCRLHRIEVEQVGDVSGKSLLHLQCHFGIDTLSWARRGAKVTGIDFSPKAIEAARRLSKETGVPGDFVCSNLYELCAHLDGQSAFDIVYTSYGVICWLPDLVEWGRIIAHFLKPGGLFYIIEAHPVARMFPMEQDMPKVGAFRPWMSYFHNPAGARWPGEADYANPEVVHQVGAHDWQHSMADIVNSLIGAGLQIESLHEFPFCAWPVVAGCEVVERFSDSHAYYGLPASQVQIPLMFSIRARKP